jgi:hypothetical protein
MLAVDGEGNERLVLHGKWLEKQGGGEPKVRLAVSSLHGVKWKEFDKRKKLFGVAGLERALSV